MADEAELTRIREKTDAQKLTELLTTPAVYCADMATLIDHHLGTDLGVDMRRNLQELRAYIVAEPEGYRAEQIMLLTLV